MSKQNSNLFPVPPKLPIFPTQSRRDGSDKELDNLDNLDELDAQVTGDELVQDIEPPDGVATPEPATEEPQPSPEPPRSIRAPIPIMPALGRTGDVLWGQSGQAPEKPKSDMDDLFEVPEEDDNDMYTDDLFEVDEEDVEFDDDLSDLTRVTEEDIMGKKPVPRPQQFRRTRRQYNPPASMGGVG